MEVPPPPPSFPSTTPGTPQLPGYVPGPPPVPTPGPSAPPSPTPPGGGSGAGAGPRRSGLALASMILGVVGLVTCFILNPSLLEVIAGLVASIIPSLLAVIFGLVASRQIKRGSGALTGAGLALAGWIMGLVGLVVGGIFIAAAAAGVFDVETNVFDLEPGECVNFDFNTDSDIPTSDIPIEVGIVDVIDCDEEYDAEVIRVGDLNPTGDRDYPSNDELFEEISAACGRRDLSRIFTVAPNADSWQDDSGPFVCFELSEA